MGFWSRIGGKFFEQWINLAVGVVSSIVAAQILSRYTEWAKQNTNTGPVAFAIAQIPAQWAWILPTIIFVVAIVIAMVTPPILAVWLHRRQTRDFRGKDHGAEQLSPSQTQTKQELASEVAPRGAFVKAVDSTNITLIDNRIGEGMTLLDAERVTGVNAIGNKTVLANASVESNINILELLSTIDSFWRQRELMRPSEKDASPDDTMAQFLARARGGHYDDDTRRLYMQRYHDAVNLRFTELTRGSTTLETSVVSLIRNGPNDYGDIPRIVKILREFGGYGFFRSGG